MRSAPILGLLAFSLLISACRRQPLNAIPEVCYAQEYARFAVNGQPQTIREGEFQGVSLYYAFSVKSNGEWSASLESADYDLSINCAAFIPQEELNGLSQSAWETRLQSQGAYSLLNSPLVQQILLNDFSAQHVYTQAELFEGGVSLKPLAADAQGCHFVEVDYHLGFSREAGDTLRVQGRVYGVVEKRL